MVPLVAGVDQHPLPYRSANEVWTERVTEGADRPAFRVRRSGGTGPAVWRDVSFGEADAQVRRLAAGFISCGLAPGDRVCVLAETRLEWILAELAVLFAGALVVPIYPSSTPAQIAHIIRDSGASAIVVENAAQLEKAIPLLLTGLPLLVHIE